MTGRNVIQLFSILALGILSFHTSNAQAQARDGEIEIEFRDQGGYRSTMSRIYMPSYCRTGNVQVVHVGPDYVRCAEQDYNGYWQGGRCRSTGDSLQQITLEGHGGPGYIDFEATVRDPIWMDLDNRQRIRIAYRVMCN